MPRFHHFAANPATFTATVEAAPGQKAVTGDFVPEAKDGAIVVGPAGDVSYCQLMSVVHLFFLCLLPVEKW